MNKTFYLLSFFFFYYSNKLSITSSISSVFYTFVINFKDPLVSISAVSLIKKIDLYSYLLVKFNKRSFKRIVFPLRLLAAIIYDPSTKKSIS